jgi:hypothetical protein
MYWSRKVADGSRKNDGASNEPAVVGYDAPPAQSMRNVSRAGPEIIATATLSAERRGSVAADGTKFPSRSKNCYQNTRQDAPPD